MAALSSPATAQIPTAIHGRVEDSATRLPVPGAWVYAADDPSSGVLTDTTGAFMVVVPDQESLALYVERDGYLAQRFDLAREARLRMAVLLLEEDPMSEEALVIDGITAVAEAAITTLQTNLKSRRNAWADGAVRAYDRAWLDRFGVVGGSALDQVLQRDPMMKPCRADNQLLCVRGRSRSVANPFPEIPLLICIDGRTAKGGTAELSSLPLASVALIEVLVRNRVAVYTQDWMLSSARRGRTTVTPLVMGC